MSRTRRPYAPPAPAHWTDAQVRTYRRLVATGETGTCLRCGGYGGHVPGVRRTSGLRGDCTTCGGTGIRRAWKNFLTADGDPDARRVEGLAGSTPWATHPIRETHTHHAIAEARLDGEDLLADHPDLTRPALTAEDHARIAAARADALAARTAAEAADRAHREATLGLDLLATLEP